MKGRGIEHRIIIVDPCDGWWSPCSLASCHRTAAAGDTDTGVGSAYRESRESQDSLSVSLRKPTCKNVGQFEVAPSDTEAGLFFYANLWEGFSDLKGFFKGRFLDAKYESHISQTNPCVQENQHQT